MRIRILIKVMRIIDPPGLYFKPPSPYCERPRLHFEPLKLLNFDFNPAPAFRPNADPDPASKINSDPDTAFKMNADPDSKSWSYEEIKFRPSFSFHIREKFLPIPFCCQKNQLSHYRSSLWVSRLSSYEHIKPYLFSCLLSIIFWP
jgi:hypothetical protein